MAKETSWTYAHEKLTISVTLDETQATVVFRGESDARDPIPFFTSLTKDLVAKVEGKKAFIDFRPLFFMNSATVAAILVLVRALDAHSVPTQIGYDTQVSWQRVNFNCMKVIARTLRHVVVGN
jgi:hypothetical protein